MTKTELRDKLKEAIGENKRLTMALGRHKKKVTDQQKVIEELEAVEKGYMQMIGLSNATVAAVVGATRTVTVSKDDVQRHLEEETPVLMTFDKDKGTYTLRLPEEQPCSGK